MVSALVRVCLNGTDGTVGKENFISYDVLKRQDLLIFV
jgi:hypothetical protein